MAKEGQNFPELVATPNFPAYAIAAVSGRHVIVGGGGGAARTGIRNKFDIYELYHDGTQTKSERVVSHDVGKYCISNLTVWCEPNEDLSQVVSPTIKLAFGQEEKCALFQLYPKLESHPLPVDDLILSDVEENNETEEKSVRKRYDESKMQDIKQKIARKRKMERIRRESINSTLRGDNYFTFDVSPVVSVETVFKKNERPEEDVYQKVVKISPNHKILATGGTDGVVRLWSLPEMSKLNEGKCHEQEIDDLDYRPDGKQIVTVCKPTKECSVWNLKNLKRVVQLALPTNGLKYKFYRGRYGTVEGDKANTCLFTISNSISGTKHPGILCKWETKTYTVERTQKLTGTLSSLAVSDNGRYVAAGTMDGSIYVLIGFSLQIFQKIDNAHNVFITGLEWLPTNDSESKMVRGFSDASVLSISCDNTLKIHHIPRQEFVPLWVVALLSIVILSGSFVIASMLGL